MASNTPNLGLTKADGSDLVSLANHINANWDIIDGKLDGSASGDLHFDSLQHSTSSIPTLSGFALTSHTFRWIQVVNTNTVFMWHRGSISGTPSGTFTVTLPFTMAWNDAHRIIGTAVANTSTSCFLGSVIQSSSTQVQIANQSGTGLWNATAPFTWSAGHDFAWFGTVERA